MQACQVYSTTTKSIKVTVIPFFVPEQSLLHQSIFFWAYHIRIENLNSQAVKLLSRHWKIIDADGNIQEVAGSGVVGQQPVIEPAGLYQYSSGAYLKSSSGMMLGKYKMQNTNDQEKFDIMVPTFSLDSPYEFHKLS